VAPAQNDAEVEEQPPPERDRTQPALIKIKELLAEVYDFKSEIKEWSRNPDELAAGRLAKVQPPMSNTAPAALLAALESVFARNVPENDARRAIKKALAR
jgi:hypothetical protein